MENNVQRQQQATATAPTRTATVTLASDGPNYLVLVRNYGAALVRGVRGAETCGGPNRQSLLVLARGLLGFVRGHPVFG